MDNLVHIASLVLLVPLNCLGIISQKWSSETVPLYISHCHSGLYFYHSLPSLMPIHSEKGSISENRDYRALICISLRTVTF